MRRVALATLRHDALRTAMLVAGLGVAWGLVTVQLGLRRGFELQSRAVLDHVGGDLWITARGVRVVDDGEPVAREAVAAALGRPCVVAARPLIVDYTQARRPDGSLTTVQVVGVDGASRGQIPWALADGDRRALEEAGTAVIEAADAGKLGLADAAVGREVELRGGARLRVVGLARGAQNFTQTPYLFTGLGTARALAAMPGEAATYWALDLRGPGCADEVRAELRRAPGVAAVPRAELARTTSEHWIQGSGIGALLAAGSLMAAGVGAVALLQSAITLVRTHGRELATVRALGATRAELGAFVAWQVGVVAAVAALLAHAVAAGMTELLRGTGLVVVVDARSLLATVLVAALTTLLSALLGARLLGRVDPREVLE